MRQRLMHRRRIGFGEQGRAAFGQRLPDLFEAEAVAIRGEPVRQGRCRPVVFEKLPAQEVPDRLAGSAMGQAVNLSEIPQRMGDPSVF